MSRGLKMLVFGALCLVWSSTWVMIKVGLEGAPPFTAAGLRFIIASLLVVAIVAVRRIRLPLNRRFVSLGVFLGVFQMGLAYALVYWAEQYIDSGLTAVLFSSMPLMVAILARIFLGDAITLRKLGGIVAGTAGVYVIFLDGVTWGGERAAWGIGAALASALCASVSSIAIKRHSREHHPFASLFLPMLIGGSLQCLGALVFERDASIHWNVPTVGSIVYLAVIGSVTGFALYFWLIKHLDVTVLSYQTFIIPVLAFVLGWIFLGETITLRIVLGGALILGGIGLATSPAPRRKLTRET